MIKNLLILPFAAIPALCLGSERALHIPMEADGNGVVTELVSGTGLEIHGRHLPENVAGASGKALRFDGYPTYVQGLLPELEVTSAMTISLWVAPETYPIVKIDEPTEEKIRIAGTLDEETRSGWSFNLGYTGKYAFECYTGGWKVSVDASDIIPCYEWSHLVAVIDGNAKRVTLYRNGENVGEAKCMSTIDKGANLITIGKSEKGDMKGPFLINTFNGVIDEIEVFGSALSEAEISAYKAESPADLSIPESRFADDLLRPAFHGMPAAGWTNECHGMTYSDGRFHLFFQKNANGPYMTRLHWGHISSENLYDWKEEKIAIAPGESYDIKGCWSGCVFTDDVITGGKPNIIYTGVDYQKAMISQAVPEDDDLIQWSKSAGNPIINGRPSGLSDDFRDPYFFRSGDDAYIIVGTSKGGVGAATLHRYDPSSRRWSNDGKIFFAGESAGAHGTFWEMPNVTPMESGKWLFTVTPQNTSTGVHTLYWVGTIADDGTFVADAAGQYPRNVELMSKDGYGLLSPTIYQHNGKTIALGIVPDKISTEDNCRLGWAHTYSFPREWSLSASGELIQKPYEGLRSLRSDVAYSGADEEISGVKDLSPVSGRRIELLGRFEIGDSTFGFNFFKSASGQASVSYNRSSNELMVDFTGLRRLVNDNGSYNGIYRCTLPERPEAGSEMLLNVFIDGSIVDIFVNDRWATSIRVYPSDEDADGVEAFCDGTVKARELKAWRLDSGGGAGIGSIPGDEGFHSDKVNVSAIDGTLIKHNERMAEALDGLKKGVYVVNGCKVIVK